ncbi:MAG: MBL fold metallo-hydrolase [Candidatus Omnitrophica bacterium]|nr:MBL fold metallo-hydrolase [Candidatus Omnitrophota bacterium]
MPKNKLPENLILKQIEVGHMDNYSYFLGSKKTGDIAIVDPGWDIDYLSNEAEANSYKVAAILLTHGHYDHAKGASELLSIYDVPVYVSKKEVPSLGIRPKNLSSIEDGQKIKIGDIEIECLFTPGHTGGSVCFRYENVLLTGDTLFIDGCGRCDLPGGDPSKMYKTLYEIILKLPENIIIYPGHNYGSVPFATLAEQKTTNPYLTCKSEDEFLKNRMGIW